MVAFMVKISLENVLWGGEQGVPASTYGLKTQNFWRSSTLLKDTPHVRFLRLYQEKGEGLLKSGFYKETDYYRNLCECIEQCGNYFNITNSKDAGEQMRRFIDHFKGKDAPRVYHQSDGQDPLVAKNAFSDYYEIVDGIHRLAIDYVKGEKEAECRLSSEQPMTLLQKLILGNAWTPGQKLLYQPIQAPELESFTLVRKCTDRFKLMQKMIDSYGWDFLGKKYLDLGCSYGFFMNRMEALGMRSYGVDSCPNSIILAQVCYQQPRERLLCLSLENFFELNEEKYHAVSLLSVLHHFLLGRGKMTAKQLIYEVDKITEKVLFLDSGQNHEEWFKESLPDWNEERMVEWLKENTTFDDVIVLGKDEDNVGVYALNYHRSLVACIRK
ncbi:putative uncharacterized protein [Waddlia chondrophila 2032/99]|nr:putative uncharacterized protein [Waddlia chondrophila 2032/99]